MFERYTERARRVIFFSRYEASQFGSSTIETEHLLLGLLREDKTFVHHFLPALSPESLRVEIRERTTIGEKTSTSIDLPLTNECKRILAYAAEEAERLNHRQIGSEHLWLGIVREEKCLAAILLHKCGLRFATMREELAHSGVKTQSSGHAPDWQALDLESVEAAAMAKIVLRLLRQYFGDLSETLAQRVMHLGREKVEALVDSLSSFAGIADLEAWLNANE